MIVAGRSPTTVGFVVFGIIGILVVGVIVGGGEGATIDAVAGFLIIAFIFLMLGADTPRRRGDDPRSSPRAPGQGGPH